MGAGVLLELTVPSPDPYEHPCAYLFRKHAKSFTFRIGATVEPSQLAQGSFAAKRCWKQTKSAMFSTGGVVAS